jgi:glycosyltransferase involved in cell wall biosynthesis
MKILFIEYGIHHKNLNFISKCKNINFYIVNTVKDIHNLDLSILDLSIFDAVYSPCQPIDVSKYPNTKFIFGPQFSVFPDDRLNIIKGTNSVYNLLSDWVINIWSKNKLCDNLKLTALPFGVDTEKFIDTKSIQERNNIIIYFKHRCPKDLHYIEDFFKNKNTQYQIFSYDNRYDENDYLASLQNAKYCIWIDAHESQGFALQEALSCNVPLLVWNVTSMNQEYGSNYSNITATTTSYWDEKCGEIFYSIDEFPDIYNKFISNLENYKPREFILENLSIDVCEKKLIEFIKKM